jgi:hypothetical protein
MQVESKRLIEIILEFDRYLPRNIIVIAIGGTAITLLGKKESTKDIDLCFETEKDKESFIKIAERLGYGHKSGKLTGHGTMIDVYAQGYIFCVQLPDDYIQQSKEIKSLNKIKLFSLNPIDLVITKTARLNERDLEDIGTIFESYDIDRNELVLRYFDVMKNSIVKDAKAHLELLADRFKFSDDIKKKIREWKHD